VRPHIGSEENEQLLNRKLTFSQDGRQAHVPKLLFVGAIRYCWMAEKSD
jgi:hypothetical protein